MVKSHENSINNAISAIKKERQSRGRPKAYLGLPRGRPGRPGPPQAGQAAPGSRGLGNPDRLGGRPGKAIGRVLDPPSLLTAEIALFIEFSWLFTTPGHPPKGDVPGSLYSLGQAPPRPSPGSQGLPARPETRKNTRKVTTQAPSNGVRRPRPGPLGINYGSRGVLGKEVSRGGKKP